MEKRAINKKILANGDNQDIESECAPMMPRLMALGVTQNQIFVM